VAGTIRTTGTAAAVFAFPALNVLRRLGLEARRLGEESRLKATRNISSSNKSSIIFRFALIFDCGNDDIRRGNSQSRVRGDLWRVEKVFAIISRHVIRLRFNRCCNNRRVFLSDIFLDSLNIIF
jgi:hypothetical protein